VEAGFKPLMFLYVDACSANVATATVRVVFHSKGLIAKKVLLDCPGLTRIVRPYLQSSRCENINKILFKNFHQFSTGVIKGKSNGSTTFRQIAISLISPKNLLYPT
jgi:hypothetical protein